MRPAVRHTPFLPRCPSQQHLGSQKYIPQPLERPHLGALLWFRGTRPPVRGRRGICPAIASRSHRLQPGRGQRSTQRCDWLQKKPQCSVRGARDREQKRVPTRRCRRTTSPRRPLLCGLIFELGLTQHRTFTLAAYVTQHIVGGGGGNRFVEVQDPDALFLPHSNPPP